MQTSVLGQREWQQRQFKPALDEVLMAEGPQLCKSRSLALNVGDLICDRPEANTGGWCLCSAAVTCQ